MARVTGKYDVGFERGEGGFSSVFGTFIGTRLKENRERYARELKAADPKNAYSILSDLMKERRQLVEQMGRAQRETMKSAGGTIRSETGGRPDTDYREKMLLENREYKNDAQRGIDHASSLGEYINGELAQMAKTEKSGQGIGARLGVTFQNLTDDMNQYEKIGVAHVLYQQVFMDPNLTPAQKDAGKLYIVRQLNYIPERKDPKTGRIVQKGTIRTDGNNRVLYMGLNTEDELEAMRLEGRSGGPKTTVTRPIGGMDPKQITAAYKPTLDALDAQIEKAREDYEIAQREYKGMIKGPDYNMALAPLSSRPSALSQSLSKYGRLREVDPSYAREAMVASEEEGKFVLPTPYEDLTSIEGAEGKSPINLMLSTTDTLRAMRGLGIDKAGEPRNEQALKEEDVVFAESSVSQMLASLNSPLYKGAEYDGARKILETHEKAFKAVGDNKEQRIRIANSLADKMDLWEGSMSQDRIFEMSKKDQPAFRVADSIRESQKAYDRFLQTRDAEQYRAEIAQTYNDLLNTPKEQRGLVGDAYLNEIERYESVDPSRRLPEELNFKLQGLAQSADEIAARNVLKPGYEGDLPEIDEPRIGRPKPIGGTGGRDPDEPVIEDRREAE
jgi:hypothetical protein